MPSHAVWVRPAAPGDAAAIAAIYNQGIAERIATFETEPRTPGAILTWLDAGYPVLAAGRADAVEAFAAAFPYRPRSCYEGVREFSTYVARDARGAGLASRAIAALCEEAKDRGWWKLVARVFVENEPSRRLCRRCGFREVGIYRRHARLDGRWRDCVIVEKLLLDEPV
jgi:L-amino acid N-acyltransferase YncA